MDIQALESRRQAVQQALNIEEQVLDTKLQIALRKLKGQKHELFYISFKEQIGKLAVEFTGTFIRHIISISLARV